MKLCEGHTIMLVQKSTLKNLTENPRMNLSKILPTQVFGGQNPPIIEYDPYDLKIHLWVDIHVQYDILCILNYQLI